MLQHRQGTLLKQCRRASAADLTRLPRILRPSHSPSHRRQCLPHPLRLRSGAAARCIRPTLHVGRRLRAQIASLHGHHLRRVAAELRRLANPGHSILSGSGLHAGHRLANPPVTLPCCRLLSAMYCATLDHARRLRVYRAGRVPLLLLASVRPRSRRLHARADMRFVPCRSCAMRTACSLRTGRRSHSCGGAA